jgi:alkylation response protein AidB-like acyl-CoA dehydrogenase
MNLSADQEFFRDNTRKFLLAESPVGVLREREGQEHAFDREWWRRGAELGWTSLLVAEDSGGGSISGKGLLDLVLIAEEFGHVVAPGPLLPLNVVAEVLAQYGSTEQRNLLAEVLSGDAVVAWAIDEPAGVYDASSITLHAESRGADFVLNGVKTLVESGDQADHLLVSARAQQGVTQFLIPVHTAGMAIRTERSLDLGRHYSVVEFDGAQVPRAALVGAAGEAGAAVDHQFLTAGAVQVAETCGLMTSVFDMTLEYLTDRYSFGRPLSSYQALKHQVADLKMGLETSLALATAAAQAVQEASGDAPSVVSAAKSYIGDMSTDLIQNCVQLHGGIGMTWEHDLHLFLRRATVNRFTYGTPQVHRERLAVLAGL